MTLKKWAPLNSPRWRSLQVVKHQSPLTIAGKSAESTFGFAIEKGKKLKNRDQKSETQFRRQKNGLVKLGNDGSQLEFLKVFSKENRRRYVIN